MHLSHTNKNIRVTTCTFQNCACSTAFILVKKQHFRIFEHSNIRNENKRVIEIHLLSYKTYLSINLSKI